MNKSLIALATLACVGAIPMGRAYTKDVSYGYRMAGGIPGDINRTHPASILNVLNDPTNPVTDVGLGCVFSAAGNSVRAIAAGDQAASIVVAGALARNYPTQQQTGNMSASFGGGTGLAPGPQSLLRQGFMMVLASDFAAHPPVKGAAVFVWTAVSSGNHVQGGFESFATAGSTTPVTNARWASPPDAAGTCEIEFWAA